MAQKGDKELREMIEANLDDGYIIKAIAYLRKGIGLNQSEVAEKIGMSQNAYSRLERGETKLTFEKMSKVIAAIETTQDEVIKHTQRFINEEQAFSYKYTGQGLYMSYERLVELYEKSTEEVQYLEKIVKDKEKIISLLEDKVRVLEEKLKKA